MTTRRRLLWTLLLLIGTAAALAQSSHQRGLTQATDLRAEAQRSGKVMLLLISQEYCPFCEQIKKEILLPMVAAGDFREQLLIRELSMDDGTRVRDFSGAEISGSDFALRYGVDVTPTQLFLAPDGSELAPRIVGIQTPDYFYFYVAAAIEQAIERLQMRRDKALSSR